MSTSCFLLRPRTATLSCARAASSAGPSCNPAPVSILALVRGARLLFLANGLRFVYLLLAAARVFAALDPLLSRRAGPQTRRVPLARCATFLLVHCGPCNAFRTLATGAVPLHVA